ncbi:sensor histidine kinase [Consotaella salsifontis]|uniref:histidine kinase n=1 Tax=Consotaella salsifontis TaxID=1365950 RepID=A0A1T4MRP1_9HYPH|nr:extracellular solute-binding protein [Consotaella salsifontis]SJZ69388.1 two-component system, OmpR family, sensor histidine kinase TctE [Consotaella salsifontis]
MWRRRSPNKAEGSLLQRLLTVVFAVFGLLSLVLFSFLSAFAHHAADSAYDQLLSASAFSIADSVRAEDGVVTVDLPYSSLNILGMARRDRVFYKVLGADGSLLTGYGDLPGEPLRRGSGVFADAVYRQTPVRTVRLGRFVTGAEESGWVTIVVAQTREERGLLSQRIFAYSFAPLTGAMLFSALMVWFGIRKTLQPLRKLENSISTRRPQDFTPIEIPAPTEVAPLVQAINHLMSRLKTSLESGKMFLADAAHEIRTPLAALRSQAELGVDETDPERLRQIFARIHRNAVEASELTTQLLNHAAVVHRSEAMQKQAIDLAGLAAQVVHRTAVIAENASIRVLRDGGAPERTIEGDSIILREALANLVGNAIKYGGAEPEVDVFVHGAADGRGPVVEVADRGPGIPDEEKPLVLQRYRRGSSAAGMPGSGFGLAIVTVAAEAHEASLELLDRPGGGLVVRLSFPSPAKEVTEPQRRRRLPFLPPLFLLALFLAAAPALGTERIQFPATAKQEATLVIDAAADQQFMEPLIRDFQAQNPGIGVAYRDMLTQDLYAATIDRNQSDGADIVISSAVDLQVKLVNDGYSLRYSSPRTERLPPWAKWRDEIFAFSNEPVAIVYNRDLVPPDEVPHSRDALIRLMREHEARYSGKVVTYDIANAGLGYLLATQDWLLSSQFWQLATAWGDLDAKLMSRAYDMLSEVEAGRALIGYNVLASYAQERLDAGAPIGIVLPTDYTLAVPRTAVIPSTARHPSIAGRFIDYLLSERAQALIAKRTVIDNTLPHDVNELWSANPGRGAFDGSIYRIALGPGLLVFLDRRKRERFLEQWRIVTAAR